MAHHISGFIAGLDDLYNASICFYGRRVIPLAQGFGFLPLTQHHPNQYEPSMFEESDLLTVRLAAWAKQHSRHFPVAYIETEYFGGVGGQAAMVWEGGEVVFGPVNSSDLIQDRQLVPTPLSERAINQALRYLSVDRGDKPRRIRRTGTWEASLKRGVAHGNCSGDATDIN